MVVRDPWKTTSSDGYLEGCNAWVALALSLIHISASDYKLCRDLGYVDQWGNVPLSKRDWRNERWCLLLPVGVYPLPNCPNDTFGSGLETVDDVEALHAFFQPGGLMDTLIDGLASEGIKLSGDRIRRGIRYAT